MKKKPMTVEEFASQLADTLMSSAQHDKTASDFADNNGNHEEAKLSSVKHWVKRDIAAMIRQIADVD